MGMSNTSVVATVVVVVLAMFGAIYLISPAVFVAQVQPSQVVTPGGVPITQPTACLDPGTGRTVTVLGLDNEYNPGVTIGNTPFFYRKSGDTAWTVATSGAFTATAGAEYELALGVNSTTAQTGFPQPVDGPVIKYVVPCDSSSIKEVSFTNYVAHSAVTATAFNPYDGLVISAGAPVAVSAGSPVSISTDLYTTYEKNFGTKACGTMSNVYVVRVNMSEYTTVNLQYNGADLASTVVPGTLSSAAGMKDFAFFGPVVESTKDQGRKTLTVVVDPSDTVNPVGNGGNVTVYGFDSAVFYDNLDSNHIKCGVEDEVHAEIGGASSPFTLNIYTS